MKKKTAVLLSLLMLSGCAGSAEELGYRQVNMETAMELMEAGSDYILLDVRRPEEFAEGHIPGAINIPNESIGATTIAPLGEKDQLILVYCRSGNRSKQAAEKLVMLGFTNIVEFGGILDWPGPVENGGKAGT